MGDSKERRRRSKPKGFQLRLPFVSRPVKTFGIEGKEVIGSRRQS